MICVCVGVHVTSASGDIQGISEFKKSLSNILVNKHRELDLSVELPGPYAELYEHITGERLVLKNTYASDTIQPNQFGSSKHSRGFKSFPKLNLGRPSSRKKSLFADESSLSISASVKKNQKKRAKNKLATMKNSLEKFGQHRGPIVRISTLYKLFISSSMGAKINGSKLSRNSRKRQIRLFSKPEQLHNALKSLHEIGYVLWYHDNELLRDIVFVDPQWVVNMIKTVIRHNMFTEGTG